jgi:hypothetical protein
MKVWICENCGHEWYDIVLVTPYCLYCETEAVLIEDYDDKVIIKR